jgi:hypothetical protein
MLIVLIAALALFALWQIAIVFIVIAVLTLLSGGTAFKFFRVTYITKALPEIDSSKVDEFVIAQLSQGRFVRLEGRNASFGMSKATQQTSVATIIFRRDIQFSLFVATIFLILEVLYLFYTGHWLLRLNPVTGPTELYLLVHFGFMFLSGVILMDLGVVWRYHVAKRVPKMKE